jgi:subtilisin family serine protease
VHAAGNDSKTSMWRTISPTIRMTKTEFANNVITVGALNYEYGENIVADFSNYGNSMNVFSPGVKSTPPHPTMSTNMSKELLWHRAVSQP